MLKFASANKLNSIMAISIISIIIAINALVEMAA